jgi:hypothetical protein
MAQCKFIRIDERRHVHARCRRDAREDGYCSHHHGGPQNSLAVNADKEIRRLKRRALMCHLVEIGALGKLIEEALSSPKASFFTEQIAELERIARHEISEATPSEEPRKSFYVSVLGLGLSDGAEKMLLLQQIYGAQDLTQDAWNKVKSSPNLTTDDIGKLESIVSNV